MPFILYNRKTKKYQLEIIFPGIPYSEFGTAVVMTGYILVLEALTKWMF